MNSKVVMPTLLKPGDTVAIVAASGPCDKQRLAKGVEVIKSMGLRPWVMESCYSRHEYLAGPGDLRLNDLHTAFAAKDVQGIFAARGGYGAGRLLPYIDYELVRDNPKVFVGYSDVTALHATLNQRCNLVTYHGPMPASDFDKGSDPFTIGALKGMVFSAEYGGFPFGGYTLENPPGRTLTTIVPGRAVGPIVGGNLCVLATSIGTPFELDTRGCVLFLEETNEEPYSIDRLLLQLKQSGKLRDAAGFVLGDFSPQALGDLHVSIQELIVPEGKPMLANLACGHTSPTLTLPLGRLGGINIVLQDSFSIM